MKNKIYGFVPARMASSRFPGKPLVKICGITMLEHVYLRAKLYKGWDGLSVCTCDLEIMDFCKNLNIPCIMTSEKHTRALERVSEASKQITMNELDNNDIIVCVQGDEPLLKPEMIENVINTIKDNEDVNGSMVTMDIENESDYLNPDVVKVIHDLKGDVLYTSRSPIPYSEKFSNSINAKRIYGILAFKSFYLDKFMSFSESPLEISESCDSNRLYDNNLTQRISNFKFSPSFAVDNPNDLIKVEEEMINDSTFKLYK